MKFVAVVLACGGGLFATPACAQTAGQLSEMCDFLQTGMIHRDENFSGMIAGAPDANGDYPLARPYSPSDAGCGAVKGARWVALCTWQIDGITTASQAKQTLDAVGDQVTACIGSGYKRGRNPVGFLVFSLQGEERVDVAIRAADGKYLLSIGVLGSP